MYFKWSEWKPPRMVNPPKVTNNIYKKQVIETIRLRDEAKNGPWSELFCSNYFI